VRSFSSTFTEGLISKSLESPVRTYAAPDIPPAPAAPATSPADALADMIAKAMSVPGGFDSPPADAGPAVSALWAEIGSHLRKSEPLPEPDPVFAEIVSRHIAFLMGQGEPSATAVRAAFEAARSGMDGKSDESVAKDSEAAKKAWATRRAFGSGGEGPPEIRSKNPHDHAAFATQMIGYARRTSDHDSRIRAMFEAADGMGNATNHAHRKGKHDASRSFREAKDILASHASEVLGGGKFDAAKVKEAHALLRQGVSAAVVMLAASLAAHAQEAPSEPPVAKLLEILPAETSAAVILPEGAASAEAVGKALERAAMPRVAVWDRFTAPVRDAAAVDPAGPAAVLAHRAGPGDAVRRVRVFRTKPGADPLAGAGRAVEGDYVTFPSPANGKLYGRAAGGFFVLAEDKAAAEWFFGSKKPVAAVLPAERAKAVAGSAIALRLTAVEGNAAEGVSGHLKLLGDLPGVAAAEELAAALETLISPAESMLTAVAITPEGLRPTVFADFAPGSAAAEYIAKLGPPKPADALFAGLATGRPVLALSAVLSPEAGRAGIEPVVANAAARLREQYPDLPKDFEADLLRGLRDLVGSVEGFSAVAGLPPDKRALFGLQGLIDTTGNDEFLKALGAAIPAVNKLLDTVARPRGLPVEIKRTTDAAKIGGKPAETLEAAITGEGLIPINARALLAAIVGPDGLKFVLAPTAPDRIAYSLAGGEKLLEQTVAGTGAVPADKAFAKAQAALPGPRHVTLLVSPGRVLYVGRSFSANVLRLPEWKPFGFIALAAAFSGRAGEFRLDVPWEEVEEFGQWYKAVR
jgi:hypothetical protein